MRVDVAVNLGVIANAIVIALLGAGLKYMRDLRDDVRRQNGRVTRLEEWRGGREALDDERHKNNLDSMGKLWEICVKILDRVMDGNGKTP